MNQSVPDTEHVEVTLGSGRVRGHRSGAVTTFLGIPYGADTGGTNRFRSPRPVEPWTGVRDAFAVGQACPQVAIFDSVEIRPDIEAAIAEGYDDVEPLRAGALSREKLGEDCLNLNVWAPASAVAAGAQAKLPVLVWLHGGALMCGSGSFRRTAGHNLAKRGDVVSVAVNHRLGAFGYLHLTGLCRDPSVATAGNNGMLDIVLALQWVRDNIANFGGDPDRVTIFGYSGGGYKVTALLGMPAANGLFHRAIAQSGFNEGADAASMTELARRLLEQLKVDPHDVDAVRAVPAARIVQAQQELGGVGAGFSTVVDGSVIPAPVTSSIRAGASGQVPLIVGFTREEMATFVAHAPGYGRLTWEDLPEVLNGVCGDRATDALELYRKARPEAGPSRLWAAILSDLRFGMPGVKLLEAHAADPARRTWAYFSTWTSSVLPDLYAAHSIDEVLYFDNAAMAPATRDTPDGAALGRKLSEAWVAFARNGDPNSSSLPSWPEYELPDRATMIVDTACRLVHDPIGAERAFWSASDEPSRKFAFIANADPTPR